MKDLARQPILNRARELYACDLLFRSSLENSRDQRDLELWEKISALVSELGMNGAEVSAVYVSAVDWSTDLRRNVVSPVRT